MTDEEILLSDALDAYLDRKFEADEMYGEVHDERHNMHCAEAWFAYESMKAFYDARAAAGMKGRE